MARLRKPIPEESAIFRPPPSTRATRSSPRKTQSRNGNSQDDESLISNARSSRQKSLYVDSSSDESDSPVLIPKPTPTQNALLPRKQRVLRPVESNSRLLRKLSNDSLASPEKRQRERRARSDTSDMDIGNSTHLQYSRSLVRSVMKKQGPKSNMSIVDESELQLTPRMPGIAVEKQPELAAEIEEIDEEETSTWCGDEEEVEAVAEEQVEQSVEEEMGVGEDEDEDDDEDPVPLPKPRQRQAAARRIISDSEDDEEEEQHDKGNHQVKQKPEQPQALPELKSLRPPHRKGHSTISNWAQEVVDLTSSQEPPASFVLPPPTKARTLSFQSSRPTTSSSNEGPALLTYSPTPTKKRSPCKAPPMQRPGTPPLAPTSPNKLVSPSKKKPAIPKADHLDSRPSLDAFWNPTDVNEWNERHSPAKPLVSPKKQKWRDDIVKMMEGIALDDDDEDEDSDASYRSPTTSPKKKPTTTTTSRKKPSSQPPPQEEPPTPSIKALRAQRKAFALEKHTLAATFLTLLDSTLCSNQISTLSASTGGIKLIWSRTLKTTAGRANWRREQIRLRSSSSSSSPIPSTSPPIIQIRHHCSIELAEKVISDSPTRLYNVLAHEFCHLATFMVSGVRNAPHGREFQAWGAKVTEAFGQSHGVQVTTKHSYAIEYKYVWECVACGYEFKRHSKSVDTQRHSCGKCKGRLVQTRPTPRGVGDGIGGKGVGNGEEKGEKKRSEYQIFVKENFHRVKEELGRQGKETQMGKVMEIVAREYRERKERRERIEKAENDGVVDVEALDDALGGLKI